MEFNRVFSDTQYYLMSYALVFVREAASDRLHIAIRRAAHALVRAGLGG